MIDRFGKRLFGFIAVAVLIYLLFPIVFLFLAALSSDRYFTFPIQNGFSLKWFEAFFNNKEYLASLRVSAITAAISMAIGLAAGVPAAFAIKRFNFRGGRLVNSSISLLLAQPRVIRAIALLQFLAAIRLLGSTVGLVLAHSLLVMPYAVRYVTAGLAFVDADLENAALSLGASPRQAFFRITFPLVIPSIIISAMFGFVASFTDSVVAVFISGIRNITFPVRVFVQQRGQGMDPVAIAGSAIVILVIVLLELLAEKAFKWSKYV